MISLISINANGLRDPSKRAAFIRWIHSIGPDLVCIQETHSTSDSEITSWFSSSGYLSASSHGSNKSSGVCTLFKSSFKMVSAIKDDSGRFLLCHFDSKGKFFQLANVYAPNRNPDRDAFFEDISASLDPSCSILLAGDFNSVFDPSVDRRGGSPSDLRESSSTLSDLFDLCSCSDTWRFFHPDLKSFSWTKSDGSIASRIDLLGCPFDWIPSVSSCDFLVCPYSDHSAVSLSVSIPDSIPRGPGFWKLNSAVLEEAGFVNSVHSFWASWQARKSSFRSLLNWWDIGKHKIKNLAINYCKDRAATSRKERSRLTALASEYKALLDAGQTSCLPDYKKVLMALKSLDLAEAKGAQVRSRIRWVEEGESSSAYFCRLEKKRSSDRWFSAIRNEDGSFTSDLHGMVDAWSSFYKDLFSWSSVDSSVQDEMLDNLESCLSHPEAMQCEGYLSAEEVLEALKGMAHNKSPGLDGLPMEFYVKFWDLIGSDLVSVLNHAFDAGTLSLSQRRGLISLLFKRGDRFDMANWRPITLLCVDYKIASRCIAGRLLKVISSVVAPDQTCGVPGRYIGENVALLRDVVSYVTGNNLPAAVLSFDQMKAFDRVDWSFMFRTLTAMGFGPSFCSWVKLFYTDPQSAVLVNGYTSDFFSLSRGVRQGCPLSPLLYVLVAEVLACNIRADPRIRGITLPSSPDQESLLSQYADDTSLIVTNDESILAAFNVYSKYEGASGAKLNLKKCKGLWLGAWNGRSSKPIDIEWSSEKVKTLGVVIGPGNLEHANWDHRLEAVDNVFRSWRQRVLSLQGKLVVINVLALSRLWYVASLIAVPSWVITHVNRSLFNFFWSGKKDLVARKIVCLPKHLGGFGLVDVGKKIRSLHAMWVKRFFLSSHHWRSYLLYWFPDIASYFRSPDIIPAHIPSFYHSVLSAWASLDGGFMPDLNSLCIARHSDASLLKLTDMSTRHCYSFLLSRSPPTPHCEVHFAPGFGLLYWAATWKQVHLFPTDRPVTDLAWKSAHGVLYTAQRLISFGYNYSASCFCNAPLESIEHLFFYCPLAQSGISWIQFHLLSAVPAAPELLCRHVLFGFTPDELRAVPPVFVYLLHLHKYFIWRARNDFRFRDVRPSAIELINSIKIRLKFNLSILSKRFVSSRAKRRFVRQWGASGRFAKYSNGSIILVI